MVLWSVPADAVSCPPSSEDTKDVPFFPVLEGLLLYIDGTPRRRGGVVREGLVLVEVDGTPRRGGGVRRRWRFGRDVADAVAI